MAKKILAVDDSATMLQTISIALEGIGYEVTTALNGAEGVEVLNRGEKFSAVITDLNMPKMDGISFIAEARKIASCKFVPIIVLTTESQMQKKDQAKKAGATGWIVKPFKPEQLVTVIKKLCP